ncbi:hypothetical protein MRX96_015916 [Rhipicephalus microplus]
MPRRHRPMEPKRMHPPSRLHFVIRVKPRQVQRELPRETLYAKSTLTKRIAPQLRQRERDWTAAMILPITALRLAVAAAVGEPTRAPDNSTWLPPPLPSSFIPDKPDPGLTPDYNTRIRLPQNSTDVLTVADIAEIESMLVRLNETTNDTSSFEGETPTETQPQGLPLRASLSLATRRMLKCGQRRRWTTKPRNSSANSSGLKSGDRVEKTHEDLVEPSSLLQKDEDGDEQVRDRRQAMATSSITSASNDVVSTTAPSQKPTTVAPSEQQSPVVAEATTVVPLEETTLVVTEPTTIAAFGTNNFKNSPNKQ